MIYKTLKKVSDVCQLLDKSKYPATQTIYGVTFTNNGDGTITVNGTCTNPYYSAYKIKENLDGIISGHKYAILGAGTNMNIAFAASYQGGYIWEVANKIITLPENEYTSFDSQIRVAAGVSVSNITVKPQIFDLTEMYRAGNEPTTVEQFRQDFPEEMYDYKPYCFVKSYKTLLKASDYCQLLDKRRYPATKTINGITFTNNNDGTITANGTATSTAFFLLFKYTDSLMPKHKYLLYGSPNDASASAYIQCYDDTNFQWLIDTGGGGIAIFPKQVVNPSGATNIRIRIEGGYTANNLIFKPQLFDLTEIFGAGNEPTTVEEFRQKFPNELYDYKPYSIITSYKKSLVCKTKNLFDINSAVKHSGASSFSKNGNQIIVSQNSKSIYSSANVPLDTSLVGKTVTVTAFAKTSGKNTAVIRIQWLNNTGGVAGKLIISKAITGTSFQKITLTGVVPEKPDEDHNTLGLLFYSNTEAVLESGVTYSSTYTDIMIELGDTATEYHPYGYL